MKFTLEECMEEGQRFEIEQLLKQEDISEIFRLWVKDSRTIQICSGFDEITNQKQAYLIFSSGSDVASAYIYENDLLAARPSLKELIPPNLKAFNYSKEIDLDRGNFFIELEKKLKGNYDNDLNMFAFSPQAAIDAALGLSLGEFAETTFSAFEEEAMELLHDDDDDDEEEAKEQERKFQDNKTNFIFALFERGNKQQTCFEGYSCAIDMRLCEDEILGDSISAELCVKNQADSSRQFKH